MKHIKLFEGESQIQIFKDFVGVKIYTNDSETLKSITKLAKEHKMFLLASHSGVRYYISEIQSDVKAFKKATSLL